MTDCVFCRIISGDVDERIDMELSHPGDVAVFSTISPHVPGHLLVVPWQHVQDALEDPDVTARTMWHAARVARLLGGPVNILTSAGAEATQTVFHLHIHILPRGPADKLLTGWPWRCGTVHDQNAEHFECLR